MWRLPLGSLDAGRSLSIDGHHSAQDDSFFPSSMKLLRPLGLDGDAIDAFFHPAQFGFDETMPRPEGARMNGLLIAEPKTASRRD